MKSATTPIYHDELEAPRLTLAEPVAPSEADPEIERVRVAAAIRASVERGDWRQ